MVRSCCYRGPAPLEERREIADWPVQVYSQALQRSIPLAQVVNDMQLVAEDHLILRRDRKRTLTVMADHDIFGEETAAMVLERIRPTLKPFHCRPATPSNGAVSLRPEKGYQRYLPSLPFAFVVMFVITVLLFSSIRQAGVLWTTVPLSVIGVTLGLALTINVWLYGAAWFLKPQRHVD